MEYQIRWWLAIALEVVRRYWWIGALTGLVFGAGWLAGSAWS